MNVPISGSWHSASACLMPSVDDGRGEEMPC